MYYFWSFDLVRLLCIFKKNNKKSFRICIWTTTAPFRENTSDHQSAFLCVLALHGWSSKAAGLSHLLAGCPGQIDSQKLHFSLVKTHFSKVWRDILVVFRKRNSYTILHLIMLYLLIRILLKKIQPLIEYYLLKNLEEADKVWS